MKRIYINIYPDDANTQNDLKLLSERLLTGDADTNIALLRNYADENYQYRKPIDAITLIKYLNSKGVSQKNLAHDSRILPAITKLQQEFADSIESGLQKEFADSIESGLQINPLIHRQKTQIIPRQETQTLINALSTHKNIILHGKAGYGKSCVLYDAFTNYLNILYLPIRLDRREPQHTTAEFGKQMGLPDSPARCLSGITPDNQACVLILDQLDTLRWTASHSKNALDVCKHLVQEIQSLQTEGKKISVVICCRSFDLDNDPEIKHWLSNGKENKPFEKIAVERLSTEIVQQTVGNNIFTQLNKTQKEILSNIQHLTMWQIIHASGKQPNFKSATDLMRKFWEDRYELLEKKVNLSSEQVKKVLKPLIQYMESKQKLSAPERLVSKEPNSFKALQSYGILQLTNGEITFCHQNYLDYQIASNLIEQIESGENDVLSWLGGQEKQSLFRREQLRQVLSLLADETPQEWLTISQKLLTSDSVRFHLKYLVLMLIGQQENVFSKLGAFCLTFLNDEKWHKQIVETVCLAHSQYVQFLIDNKVITDWLDSENEQYVNEALWLLRSVAEKIPDAVTDVIEPYIDKGESWYQKIFRVLCWSEEKDSDKMFLLRLRLIHLNIYKYFINWKEVASHCPLRIIELLEAIMSTWQPNENNNVSQQEKLHMWNKSANDLLNQAVRQYPKETWVKLMPQIERLTASTESEYDSFWYSKWWKNPDFPSIKYGIVTLVISAGKTFATQNPTEFIQNSQAFVTSNSYITQRLLIEAYAKLPPSHADEGILWLLADLKRFQLGDGHYEVKWQPAIVLIKNLSPYCSDELFNTLEKTIYYFPAEDKNRVKNRLNSSKEGWFGDYWGRTQYFLLPALSPKRRTRQTNELIVVLHEKFSSDLYSDSSFCHQVTIFNESGGSKLSPNLNKFSNNKWLKIIEQSEEKIPKTGNFNKFSHSLERIASRFPERFGQLALQFPDTVAPNYISAILRAVQLTKPDNNTPTEEHETWQPASIATVEAVLNKYRQQTDDDRETAMSFCRLVAERCKEHWSDASINQLIDYAQNYIDPILGELNVTWSNASENYVRGSAIHAIAQLFWHHNEYLDKFTPCIEQLVQDAHPVIRMASIKVLLPYANHNKSLAVKYFCVACQSDVRIMASHYAIYFVKHTIKDFFSEISPLIRQMLDSSLENVVEKGSEYITGYWLFYGFFAEELERCKQGSVAHRKGVATIAESFVTEQKYTESCKALLQLYFNDEDKDVRRKVGLGVLCSELFNDVKHHPFIAEYIQSVAFKENFESFIHRIKEMKGSLLFFKKPLLEACEQLLTLSLENNQKSEMARDYSEMARHYTAELSSILLRLYEQAQGEYDDETASECLDMWDKFFQHNIGTTRELLKSIESS
ncbi:hypothetical protein [Beggiatoa leptomitoformis]|uniref:Uncharacterized protein n=1 Tax=Beggiatoa leptomitoformis TaxID=288004 RepID=A0A2N9YDB1_9GAMM|nr:hypothetical protein [Beggiatoa leptomitoformis]ALG69124.2 hypothetical protein AL038_17315 [Beggiatoa leptomitoformis]AUI68461.2 hypothetical protein BLE401_06905 [Beggiatoa leptomitoformis]